GGGGAKAPRGGTGVGFPPESAGMASAYLIDVVTLLASPADDVRVLLRPMADEAMRYLYVASSVGAGTCLSLAGIVAVTAAAITLTGRRLDASCRTSTRRGSRGVWTSRRSVVFLRPRARSGGAST